MRRLNVCMLLVSLMFFFFVGCCYNKAFVAGVDNYADTILPDYRAYVNGDDSISEDSKRIRLQTADMFRALIDDEKECEE